MTKAYIALGSNISPRANYLIQAIEYLEDHPQVNVVQQSSIYETIPVGYTEQSDFLNMVVEVNTQLPPYKLLDVCQQIEMDLGRVREVRWGPRTIDLDILLYNQENIETELLSIPHPRMHERAFVLMPLYEVDPQFKVPFYDRTVADLVESLSEAEIKGVKKWKPKKGENVSGHIEN